MAILKFPSAEAMFNFQMITDSLSYEFETDHITLTGQFTDAQLELARNGYQATIIEVPESLNK